jgi:hypothetical protein
MERSDLQVQNAQLISMIKFIIPSIDQDQETIELLHNLEYTIGILLITME